MDKITKERRTWNMQRIRSKDTLPEIKIRSALFRMGYRFRLHSAKLVGRPDIILPKYKLAIFVNGCFWHRHPNCKEASFPKSNSEYWENKIQKNIARDIKVNQELTSMGWKILIIWECEIYNDINLNINLLQSKNIL